jgi:hypothetical protein
MGRQVPSRTPSRSNMLRLDSVTGRAKGSRDDIVAHGRCGKGKRHLDALFPHATSYQTVTTRSKWRSASRIVCTSNSNTTNRSKAICLVASLRTYGPDSTIWQISSEGSPKDLFWLLRIKIEHMELSNIPRENTDSPPTQCNECESSKLWTARQCEVFLICPCVPIRLYFSGFDLPPTFRDVNKKFGTRYYFNLILFTKRTDAISSSRYVPSGCFGYLSWQSRPFRNYRLQFRIPEVSLAALIECRELTYRFSPRISHSYICPTCSYGLYLFVYFASLTMRLVEQVQLKAGLKDVVTVIL